MADQASMHRFPVNEIEDYIARVLAAVDLSEQDARTVARLMTEADVNGADGHGVFRLPGYVRRIREGGMNVRPDIRIDRETASTALVNGDNAMGHLVMDFATRIAIDKARQTGVAWVGAHHSNHAGAGMLWVRQMLAHDMIGIYSAVASSNHMPPWGGIDKLLGTNPIAFAIPAAEGDPIVLDMATTVAAYGKVKTAAQRGEMMPEGWMLDNTGQPLLDPKRSNEGFLLPIGGPKGYGLSLVLGLLAGTLNGAAMGKEVVDFNADYKTVTNTGHFIAAISIDSFMDPGLFKAQVDALAGEMKGVQKLPGVDNIRLPGENSAGVRRDRLANGVPLHQNLVSALKTLAAELDVPPLA